MTYGEQGNRTNHLIINTSSLNSVQKQASNLNGMIHYYLIMLMVE